MRKDVKQICRQNDHLTGINQTWMSYYQDLANFTLPRKAWINSIKWTGETLKYNFLYDTRMIKAAKKCAAGFHSQLSNPASKWWGMTTKDIKFRDSRASQFHFKEVEDILYSLMGSSNFDDTIQEHYMDRIVFGTGNICTLEDSIDTVRYTEIPVEQYNFEVDVKGRTCAMYRNFQWSAVQCWMEWGERCSKEIKDAIRDEKFYIMFDLLHYVGPRDRRDVGKKDKYNKPWESLWIVKKERHILEEGGFNEFPYEVGVFWKDVNDPRGYSPAMDVLANGKLANAQKRTIIKTAMQIAGPAHLLPDKGFVLPFNLNPHATNYYDAKKTNPEAFRQIESKGNIPLTLDMIKLEQDDIDDGFYVKLFESLSNITKQMTIPEIQRRIAENMQMVGPAVGRMTGTLRNVLFRTYAIAQRAGKLPPAPKELQGQELEIMFLSPLAKAQRASEMTGIGAYMQAAEGIAQFKPEVVDGVDADRLLHIIGELNGIDPTIEVDKKKIDQIRQGRAQQQAQMQKLVMAEQAAKAAHHGAQAAKAGQEAQTAGTA